MRRLVLSLLLSCHVSGILLCAQGAGQDKVVAQLIAIERAALDRWAKGDTSGFIENAAPDITYFEPSAQRRVDGFDELKRRLEAIRGQFHIDRWEMLNPRVQKCAHLAVLTFNYVSWTGQSESRWNATEIYRKTSAGWRLMSSHWSLTQPKK